MVDPSTLPYNRRVLEYIKTEKQKGRKVYLVSGSHQSYVDKIAHHLELFTECFGTDQSKNLTGNQKRDFLISMFGKGNFQYLADSSKDLPAWLASDTPLIVNPSQNIIRQLSKNSLQFKVISPKQKLSETIRYMWKLIRPHQWVKNLLVFLPIITAHEIHNPNIFLIGIIAFFAFCTTASAIYIINDLCDINHDRAVDSKKQRPLAAGNVSIPNSLALAAILLIVTLLLCSALPAAFFFTLTVYFVLTNCYSFWLKAKPLLDVFILSALYTSRIFAGAAATAIPVTPWLIAFSLFLFTCLAFLKRYTELTNNYQQGEATSGRGYIGGDEQLLCQFGIVSGYISVLVLALYINNPDIHSLYSHAQYLWFLCIILTYWISHMWFKATRGKMQDDPVIFAIKDKLSYLLATVSIIILFLAIQ